MLACVCFGIIVSNSLWPNVTRHSVKVEYVRDPAHHCVEFTDDISKRDYKYLNDDGTMQTVFGWRSWDCANGIHVIIDNDEDQP